MFKSIIKLFETCSIKMMWFFILVLLTFGYFLQWRLNRTVVSEEVPVVGWYPNTTRDTRLYVSPEKVTLVMAPQDLCRSFAFLLVMIMSRPRDSKTRDCIRQTLATRTIVDGTRVKYYFMLGANVDDDDGGKDNDILQRQLRQENRIHNDIVQENFVDHYNNLTIKTLMMLKLINDRCRHRIKFFMKIDDDLYVNMTKLVKFLSGRIDGLGQLIGSIGMHKTPIYNVDNKWYGPKYLYPDTKYPPFLLGMGYVMSVDVAKRLYEAALVTPLYHLEDVYITGICARAANIIPEHNPLFVSTDFKPCYLNSSAVRHRFYWPPLVKLMKKWKRLDWENVIYMLAINDSRICKKIKRD